MEKPKEVTQKMMDESLSESFPASDVPAWSTSSEYHKKKAEFVPLHHGVSLEWKRKTKEFDYTAYNREAVVRFSGGASLPFSNPPQYFGKAEYANSEELFLAAVAGCYMQTFLAVASLQGYTINHYVDEAIGVLGKNAAGKMGVIEIQLNIKVKFEGVQPTETVLSGIKERASLNCFIANSITSKVNIHVKLEQ